MTTDEYQLHLARLAEMREQLATMQQDMLAICKSVPMQKWGWHLAWAGQEYARTASGNTEALERWLTDNPPTVE
jgi:hypothetical protein